MTTLVEKLAVTPKDFMPPANAARVINLPGSTVPYVVSERLFLATKDLAGEQRVPVSRLFEQLQDELNA